jgi:hypothetical protein
MSNYKYSETNPFKGEKRRINQKNYECLPEQAKWLLYENQVKLHERFTVSKRTESYIYSGVESLRYLGVAKRYVCERFEITSNDLEIFLFLYPLNYFTKKDYDSVAKPYINSSTAQLLKRGHIVVMFTRNELKKPYLKKSEIDDIYALSLTAKRAVNYFYKLLSGEMKPYHFKHAVYSKDETKNKLIKGLLEQMRDEE